MAIPSLVQALLMIALPSGGQRTARRNAWAGMAADSSQTRVRREAELAMAQAQLRSVGALRLEGTGS